MTDAAETPACDSVPLAAEVHNPACTETPLHCNGHASPAELLTFNLQPATASASFHRFPGETPRASAAFLAYFSLGPTRSLQAVADKTGEGLSTLKQWSTKYEWIQRLQSFSDGLLQREAAHHVERQRQQAADWSARLNRFREQEWDAAQKLLSAAQCFLESFGDEQLGKMTLSQVSRALRISSEIGRSALAGAELPVSSEPAMSPVQQQILHALARAYAKPQDVAPPAPASANVG